MLPRRMRFLTSRLRNFSGSKSGSGIDVGRGVVDREDLADHLLSRPEAALVVAAEGVLDLVDQALVRVGARVFGLVNSPLPLLDEVVVGDQRPPDRDAV